MNALTFDQILPRICSVYHDHFQRTVWPLLRPGEDVIWAGNWLDPMNPKALRESENLWRMGYMLFTARRWIRGAYWVYTKKSGIQILQLSSLWRVPDLPSTRLIIQDVPSVMEGGYQFITAVQRFDYEIKVNGKSRTFSLVQAPGNPHNQVGGLMYYSLQDGNEVYEILQRAIH